jgi:hypothetical protein
MKNNITEKNVPQLIQIAFKDADYGAKSLNKLVQAAENNLNPINFVDTPDDYITKIILKAINENIEPEMVDNVMEIMDDLQYAINQLTIAKNNLHIFQLEQIVKDIK